MNEKLEREIVRYKVPFQDDDENLDERTLDAIARHFYNVALEDVRKEVERQYVYWDNVVISSASPNAVASKNRMKEILDFIDNLKMQ